MNLVRAGLEQFGGESMWHRLYLAVLVGMGFVGFIVSPYHSRTRLAYFLLGLLTYGVTVAVVNSPRRFWQGIGVFALLGLAVTLIGSAGTTWTTYKLPAISVLTSHIPQAPAQFLERIGAQDGIHPNQVAGMLTLYLVPLLGFLLFLPNAQAVAPSRRLKILCGVVLTVMVLYLALSLSRSGVLAVNVAFLFLLWMRRPAWGIAALGVMALGSIGAYLLLPRSVTDTLFSSLLSTFNGTGETRTEIWRQALQAIAGAPLTGIGLYNFVAIFRYNIDLPPDSPFVILHAHNMFLQAALDLGLPGALAYVLLLADVAIHAARAGRRRNGAAAGICFGFAAALLAFGVYGLFDTIPLTSRVAWLTWFSVGMGAAAWRIWENKSG